MSMLQQQCTAENDVLYFRGSRIRRQVGFKLRCSVEFVRLSVRAPGSLPETWSRSVEQLITGQETMMKGEFR